MRLDIHLKIEEHNNFVDQRLLESQRGSPISLTELLINKEKIYKNIYEAR